MVYPKQQYALYGGEKFIALGTREELAELRGVKPSTISFFSSPSYAKRTSEKAIRVVRV